MNLLKLVFVTALLAALSGCATLTYPLPKCDGYAKRPLNRSMWNWDGQTTPVNQSSNTDAASDARATIETDITSVAAAAGIDEVRSYQACEAA